MGYSFVKFFFWLVVTGISWIHSSQASEKRYAAVVIDDTTGKILHAENAHALRHPASLTKKMTLYLIFDALKKGKITLKTRFHTSPLATRQIPSKLGLQIGHTIDVESIIKGLVTKSANDVAVVAAEGLAGSLSRFVVLMNKQAKKLGMKNTHFYNASGVPDARQISTAMDMAILARALYHHFPEYYHFFQTKFFHYQGSSHHNHNHMLKEFPGLDGIKTGFTNASGFNISTSAVRYDRQNRPHRLFAVVMGGQNRHSRDKKAAELLEEGFNKIGAYHIQRPVKDKSKSYLKEAPSQPHLVHYTHEHQRALDSLMEESALESKQTQTITYGRNNSHLLETSLNNSSAPVKRENDKLLKVQPPRPLPNIIAPLDQKLEKQELTPTFYKVSSLANLHSAHQACLSPSGKQRALPAQWIIPKAPTNTCPPNLTTNKKDIIAKVHFKKSPRLLKSKRSAKGRQHA